MSRDGAAGLVLVGGSSRIPLVATLLHQRLGIVPTVIEQPELVVAQGSLLAVPPVAEAFPARGTVTVTPPSPAAPDLPEPVSAAQNWPMPISAVPNSPAPFPARPSSPAPATDPDPSAARPTRPGRRRRTLVILGGITALVVAAAAVMLVLRVNRPPELTTQGKTNAAVFTSAALQTFARHWLNDLAGCTKEQADGGSSEKVNCWGGEWSVNFRAYGSAAGRDQARHDRRTSYELGDFRNLTGDGAGSGIRVTYLQEGKYQVVYWDDDGAPVSGDLYSTELSRADLLRIWDEHVS